MVTSIYGHPVCTHRHTRASNPIYKEFNKIHPKINFNTKYKICWFWNLVYKIQNTVVLEPSMQNTKYIDFGLYKVQILFKLKKKINTKYIYIFKMHLTY